MRCLKEAGLQREREEREQRRRERRAYGGLDAEDTDENTHDEGLQAFIMQTTMHLS
jgi:hypothetical protein